jgi:NTP pyrophosphatase (non-canonical NTP hydrolase)
MKTDDGSITLAQLKYATAKFAKERDWEQFHAPKNLSMAIAAEAGELMEHFLWVSAAESSALCAKNDKRGKIEEELADVIILALQFANMAKIDVASAISAKIAKNAAKYPVSKAKGRSDKYTEL